MANKSSKEVRARKSTVTEKGPFWDPLTLKPTAKLAGTNPKLSTMKPCRRSIGYTARSPSSLAP
jgi:hypothetical protein